MAKMKQQIVFFEEGKTLPSGSVLAAPNMVAYIRDVLDVGPIGAVVKRFIKLPVLDMVRLGLRNLPHLLKIVGKDFVSGLLILVEIELLKSKKAKIASVVLTDQVSDLGIAFGNNVLYDRFIKLAHAYEKDAGIWTNNFKTTAIRLGKWRLRPDFMVVPQETGRDLWETSGIKIGVIENKAELVFYQATAKNEERSGGSRLLRLPTT
ncbi:MAG: hypothetical protein UX31_C0008G0020 [Candidatus Nomurabacteria bacterium GW2011_GWA1_46_11]|uniref:Uncharacterized protein n=1 Tax=Candidatus Nomurabacteria bacterium GW2011_GWA1_46_11 TaxID=1618732 RepID=A0A0G1QVY2_9BACT|nr:MAG: hypothetical protein UW69_C0099G0009 [Microgenomates group bacterium GW2011_GWA2_44_7]KKT78024.1 MAG: hypothetical protein UW73_C0008G0007 [Microgenomates group bacterium GW2011_GWB1_44_8]KKU21978.1 MAG: hypothetical protein UX31_C0008G0020 [Candidatus Nomurabacteria bacterium GW2011_GWA1_46_11]